MRWERADRKSSPRNMWRRALRRLTAETIRSPESCSAISGAQLVGWMNTEAYAATLFMILKFLGSLDSRGLTWFQPVVGVFPLRPMLSLHWNIHLVEPDRCPFTENLLSHSEHFVMRWEASEVQPLPQ